jgi:hypothetical protein
VTTEARADAGSSGVPRGALRGSAGSPAAADAPRCSRHRPPRVGAGVRGVHAVKTGGANLTTRNRLQRSAGAARSRGAGSSSIGCQRPKARSLSGRDLNPSGMGHRTRIESTEGASEVERRGCKQPTAESLLAEWSRARLVRAPRMGEGSGCPSSSPRCDREHQPPTFGWESVRCE